MACIWFKNQPKFLEPCLNILLKMLHSISKSQTVSPPNPVLHLLSKDLNHFFFLFSPWISHLLDLLRTPCFLFLFSRFPSQVGIHWFFFLEGWVLDFSTNSLLNFSQNSSLNSFLSLLILFNSSPKCHYFSLGLIPHSKNHNPLLKSFQNLSPSRSYFPKKILLIAVLTS